MFSWSPIAQVRFHKYLRPIFLLLQLCSLAGFGLGILILQKRLKFMHIGFLYLAFLIVTGLSDVVSLGDPIAVNMGTGLFIGCS